ncbi:hypothetical protein HanIR_Chr14g0688001 [Helianthus annuus]|nr:hypothetical protein HanIR_Chr14g0688001 [Helianthus annuus]
MGSFKHKVNLARFAAENNSLFGSSNIMNEPKEHEVKEGKGIHNQFYSQVYAQRGGGKLFSDLFNKGNGNVRGESSMQAGDEKMVEVQIESSAFNEIIRKALVGRCLHVSALNNIHSYLAKAGYSEFSLSYLRGLSMLLKFANESDSNDLVCNHDLWSLWFSSLDPWVGQSLPFETIAWLRIIGVPIHLAEDHVYNEIAGRFGKVVHESQRTLEDKDLSVNVIGFLVGDGSKIVDQVFLKWKDK